MIVAILLRIRVLEKLTLTVGMIILMLCQYLLPTVYISRRIDRLMLS